MIMAMCIGAQSQIYKKNLSEQPSEMLKQDYGFALRLVQQNDQSTGMKCIYNFDSDAYAGCEFRKVFQDGMYHYEARPYIGHAGTPSPGEGVFIHMSDGTIMGSDTIAFGSVNSRPNSAYTLSGIILLTEQEFRKICDMQVVSVAIGSYKSEITKTHGKSLRTFCRCIWNSKDGQPKLD